MFSSTLRSFVMTAAVAGCGAGETEPTATPGCAALEIAQSDGSCVRPGVQPGGCAPGFVHDGEYGCQPVLPADPCPAGLMAVPGETACRPVMPCSEGRWGNLPVDATTEYVDAAYPGADSDGSAQKPWTTISGGVAAAAAGALIAVAEGTYVEDVLITGKPVRLWGVCPERVALVAAGQPVGGCAVCIGQFASGTEVGGLALGGRIGVVLSGSEQVVLDRLWVHGTASRGIVVQGDLGPTSVTVVGSLLEQSHELGLFVGGALATVEGTVVRATQPGAFNKLFGHGISISLECVQGICDPSTRSTALVRGSLVEQNHEAGVFVMGSDATVEGTVVRTTLPRASDQSGGIGISIQLSCTAAAGCIPSARSTALIRGSLVEQNHAVGLHVDGSDATVVDTVVRATLPDASDQAGGLGINISLSCEEGAACDPATRSTALVRNSLVQQNHTSGIFVSGSDATVEGTVVRATMPQTSDQLFGRGIGIQLACTDAGCDSGARSTAHVRGSLVEQSNELGLSVIGSDATVEGTVVRGTSALGFFGDGLAVFSDSAPASATLTAVHIIDSARAGLSNFGAFVSLERTAIACAAFALDGETWQGLDFVFEDRGHNSCGCPGADGACAVVSTGLEPPRPAAPAQ